MGGTHSPVLRLCVGGTHSPVLGLCVVRCVWLRPHTVVRVFDLDLDLGYGTCHYSHYRNQVTTETKSLQKTQVQAIGFNLGQGYRF